MEKWFKINTNLFSFSNMFFFIKSVIMREKGTHHPIIKYNLLIFSYMIFQGFMCFMWIQEFLHKQAILMNWQGSSWLFRKLHCVMRRNILWLCALFIKSFPWLSSYLLWSLLLIFLDSVPLPLKQLNSSPSWELSTQFSLRFSP